MIISAIKSKISPILKGSPGCGKSQAIHQIAEKFNLALIDIRLSQCDPTDLAGFPTVTADGKADYLPMKHFPIEGDALPQGKAGWLMFLDEATSAPPSIQAAAYKLVLDRMVGSHRLHSKCAIVLAGNLETDGAIVHSMSTALQSRMMHLELVLDQKEWLEWAQDGERGNIDHRITDYIKFKPGQLYTFSADHTDSTYACPRTWEFVSRLLPNTDEEDLLPVLAGTVSEGVAREFLIFTKIYDDLIKPEQIIADPKNAKVPREPSILFALTGSIAHNIAEDTAEPLITYVKRLPAEFQVVCLRETVRRNKKMLTVPAVRDWISTSSDVFF